jgi:hypothetical protein
VTVLRTSARLGHHFDDRYDALNRFTGLRENGDSDIAGQSYHATGERYLTNRTGAATGWLHDAIGRPSYLVDDPGCLLSRAPRHAAAIPVLDYMDHHDEIDDVEKPGPRALVFAAPH